jgi:glycosyltransferase involved in cell wall biosynthesis
MALNILILPRYSRLGASSRLRFFQYLQCLDKENITYTLSSFIDDKALKKFYERGHYNFIDIIKFYWRRIHATLKKGEFDLIWIEKEVFPWLPIFFEKKMLSGLPYVLDYDDAIFHNYDQHHSFLVRYFLGQRIDKIMKDASLVIVGNTYLEKRAIDSGAKKVKIIPTVIDLKKYPTQIRTIKNDGIPRIAWIGSPSTIKYIKHINRPLALLSKKIDFKLRIINNISICIDDVDVEFIPWTEETEVFSLYSCDIGIMPLFDSAWERGKCGYKLIQYMACGLPVVASPVGVNAEIVRKENGYLAATENDWIEALGKLLSNPNLRKKMGEAGRKQVEEEYCTQQTAFKLINMLLDVIK